MNKLLDSFVNYFGIDDSKRVLVAIKFIGFSLIFLHFHELSIFVSIEVLVERIDPQIIFSNFFSCLSLT